MNRDYTAPIEPSEAATIIQILSDGCAQAAYTGGAIMGTGSSFHFTVTGYDGKDYAVSVAKVDDLVGERRQ